jgi:hypothetical protein
MRNRGWLAVSLQFLSREETLWLAGLLWLALVAPTGPTHFTLCIFRLLDLPFCPGCGLGHSISFLFRGEIGKSLEAHYLGIPALLMLLYRIVYLLGRRIFN